MLNKINYWKNQSDDQIVCYCIKVSKETIVAAIKNGCNSISKIQKATSACTGNRCKELNPSGKCCSVDIKALIQIYSEKEVSDKESSCCGGGCCSSS